MTGEPALGLAGVAGLATYLGAAVWCDARGRRMPAWGCALGLGAALSVAASNDGMGPTHALAGAALAAGLLGLAALALGAHAADMRLAVVAGAWLGPVAVLHGTALGAAIILLAALVHAATTPERPRLATALASVRRREGGTATPLSLALPLAAGYAAAAVLAVHA